MTKIKWTNKITNKKKVLKRAKTNNYLFKTIIKRQDQLVGRVLKDDGPRIKTTMEGMIYEKKNRGRTRNEYFTKIVKNLKCNDYTELKRLSQRREERHECR